MIAEEVVTGPVLTVPRAKRGERPDRVTFHVERFRQVAKEAFPLIRAHAAELGVDQEPWRFRPHVEQIAKLEENGLAVWISARGETGALIGYALLFHVPSLIFDVALTGHCEWLYLQRDSRRVVRRFVRFCEAEMRERGCEILTVSLWGVGIENKHLRERRTGRLLRKLGYEAKALTYWRDIRGS